MSVFVCAEIGINHNGDLKLAEALIDAAVEAGCDAVKFQKRTVSKVYTQDFLESYRESPWGTTQRAQKEGLEFGFEEYSELNRYCNEKGIEWFASAWDLDSQKFLQQFHCKYNKIASPMLTNKELLEDVANEGKHTFISTGMSTWEEIDNAVAIFKKAGCEFELMHCVSVYPTRIMDANLMMIEKLKERYHCAVGYSGHEMDNRVACIAVSMGATSIEKHITLDREMYGSDQKVSLEPNELYKLVSELRVIEKIKGTGERVLSEAEEETRKKLRK